MDKDLFKTIDSVIRKERLYAQVNLMREDIMQRFNIGRHHLNDQLNTFADGMSFPQYINSIRMEVAYDLLDVDDTSPTYKALEEGSVTQSKEELIQMASRQQNTAPGLLPPTKNNILLI